MGTLFSGIGAPEFGIKSLKIKYNLKFACDNDPYVKKTYLNNHKCNVFYDDVLSLSNIPNVNLLVFGSPCQSFSIAGHRLGINDERGKLFLKTLSLIKNNPPDSILVENVEGLITHDNEQLLTYFIDELQKIGYYTNYTLLNSLNYGLPHHRNRLFIVATKTKGFVFPTSFKLHSSLKAILNTDADPSTFVTESFLLKPKVQHRLATYNNDYINCITSTISRNGSSSEYISYVAAVYTANGQLRKPSIEECSKLFGFPLDFKFPSDISNTRRYNMFANSMVVPVVSSIIKNIVKYSFE